MSNMIELPTDIYELLRHRATQLQQSPEQLAVEALRRFLITEKSDWSLRLQQLLVEVYQRPGLPASEEIEADITAAAAETRELRRERRRTD